MSLRTARDFTTAILCLAACQKPAPFALTNAVEMKAAAWQVLAARVFEHRSDGTCVSPDWNHLDAESDLPWNLLNFGSEVNVEMKESLTVENLELAIVSRVQSLQPDWNTESVLTILYGAGEGETLRSSLPTELGVEWCEGPFKDGDYRYSFTPMGFSPDIVEATVYVEMYCGSLCAQGTLYLLRRNADGWSLVEEMMLWIS